MASIIDRVKAYAINGRHKYTQEMLREIVRAGNDDFIKQISRENRETEMNAAFGRSGIMPIHQRCTIVNFEAETADQQLAKRFAANYIDTFDSKSGNGFIFAGTTGTGKNHLASAICNDLISTGKTCLVITVSELMQQLRKCYGSDRVMTEEKFFSSMIKPDLLVLDEVGLQGSSENTKLAMNQIIDQRVGHLKSIGILTNLPPESKDGQDLRATLGPRIYDRLRGTCKLIPFQWESYRGK